MPNLVVMGIYCLLLTAVWGLTMWLLMKERDRRVRLEGEINKNRIFVELLNNTDYT